MSSKHASPIDWRAKVHPFFIKAAEYQKRVLLLTRSKSASDREEATRLDRELPPELMQEAERIYDELKAAGKPRHQSTMSIYGLQELPEGSVISKEHYMFHWLCWFKFNKTVEHLMKEYKSGDLKAAKQFHRLGLEFDKWRLGGIDPNKLKFKTDLDHFDVMSAGLDLGIKTLTADELADCFDALCPCGKAHDPENLRKLRQRIETAFPAK